MSETTIKVQNKWESGKNADGSTLVLKMPMTLNIIKSDKKDGTKKTFEQLAQLGSRFGGVQIGTDDEGRAIMANISIYRRPAEIQTAGRNTPVEIA